VDGQGYFLALLGGRKATGSAASGRSQNCFLAAILVNGEVKYAALPHVRLNSAYGGDPAEVVYCDGGPPTAEKRWLIRAREGTLRLSSPSAATKAAAKFVSSVNPPLEGKVEVTPKPPAKVIRKRTH